MNDSLVDMVRSLTAIMEEETARLGSADRLGDLAELAMAKAKLVNALETETTRRSRENRDWLAAQDPAEKEELLDALRALRDASAPNQALLRRQIDLSTEILAAVAAEAKRLTGNRHAVYGHAGDLAQIDVATPISIDSRF